MRALAVTPGTKNSLGLDEVPAPTPSDGSVLARTVALGICGTDRDIVDGRYGTPPRNEGKLILGHESLAIVEEAPASSGLAKGDTIVGIVRRPDPVPCVNCAAGEWDMCRNGLFTERGIKQRHGFGSEYFRIEPEFAVRVDASLGIAGVLLEPASVLAKAWEHIERIGQRAAWAPSCVLVTGAGPVGLLAALMGIQRGLRVHVFDRHDSGPKPELVRALGGTYHTGELARIKMDLTPSIVIECTGASPVIVDVMHLTEPAGIVCLAGVSSGGRTFAIDIGMLNRSLVLENDVIFGSVNANRRHYELAHDALRKADRQWLERLVTRRVPLSRWRDAFRREPDDVKVVVDFEG